MCVCVCEAWAVRCTQKIGYVPDFLETVWDMAITFVNGVEYEFWKQLYDF